MLVVHYPEEPWPADWPHPVLALGNFDGVHRGHMKIIECVHHAAEERDGLAVAMVFDPHPSRVIRPDKAPPLLMTTSQKLEALGKAGIQGVAVVDFTQEFSRWDPDTFVRKVLVEWMHVSSVWVGANFLFGRDRAGTFSVLRSLGARYGFRADKIDPVRYKEFVVSSTRIRRLVSEGRVDEAGALLGHYYEVEGLVVPGDRRGHDLGFPTANVAVENELLPPHGVYASTARLDTQYLPSVTNVGCRPTFESSVAGEDAGDGGVTHLETHVLGFDGDLYGKRLRVGFVRRLRDERRFDGVSALREQIGVDCSEARSLFESMSL